MTAWPTGSVSTTKIDAGTDSPADARADIKTMADKVNDMVGARGAADGVAGLDSDAKVPTAQIPALPFSNGIKVWDSHGSDTWAVPAGITVLFVKANGAGGGGGFGVDPARHGGGGGAGGRAYKRWTVSPGDIVSVDVGASGGGGAGPGSADGSAGGDTSVEINGVTITGLGGQGGKGSAGSGVGGLGGGYDSTGGNSHDYGIGGGAGQSGIPTMGGVGGAGETGSAPMPSGIAGWGSGGYGSGTNGPTSGAQGAAGGVLIHY